MANASSGASASSAVPGAKKKDEENNGATTTTTDENQDKGESPQKKHHEKDEEAAQTVLLLAPSQNGSPKRITIEPRATATAAATKSSSAPSTQRVFKLDGKEALLVGGNYVMKSRPYFPPLEVVRNDAKQMLEDLKKSAYCPTPAQDGSARYLVCVVRLGCMMEGYMPNSSDKVDEKFVETLEAVIKIFAESDIYVLLDVHMDAFCASNGGDGLPWWVANEMQKTAGCCKVSGECWACCCCCGTPSPSYITTPDRPLQLMIPSWLSKIFGMRQIDIAPGETDPWKNYSIGSNTGDPGLMNVGNVNMRLNNHDAAWSAGTMASTRQAQNIAPRLYNSPYDKDDCPAIFEPYVKHVEMLCRLWERHENVIGVELLNEPPLAGLPNVVEILRCRRRLFDFHRATLEALDRCEPPIRAPIALQDGYGSLGGSSALTKLLAVIPISSGAQKILKQWGQRNQLILSFHYYPGGPTSATDLSFEPFLQKARSQSTSLMEGSPIFLTEFWTSTAKEDAEKMVEALELGVDGVTFWQYVDKNFTGTTGWFKYPPEVTKIGEPITSEGVLNMDAWKAYEPTVKDGTFFGAMLNGAAGGQQDDVINDVMSLMPAGMDKRTDLVMDGQTKTQLACCCCK